MNKIDLASNTIVSPEGWKTEFSVDSKTGLYKNLKYMTDDGKILEESGYDYEKHQKEIKKIEELVNKEINTNPIHKKAINEFVGMILGVEVKDGELQLDWSEEDGNNN